MKKFFCLILVISMLALNSICMAYTDEQANKVSVNSVTDDGLFTVYDPAIRNGETGEGILFSDSCTSYVYGFSNAVNMCVIDY